MEHKSTNDMIVEGKIIRTYREMMKMKSIDASKLLVVSQPNYSHMEKGRCNISDDRMLKMRKKFDEWRENRIHELHWEIYSLKQIN